eukprot:4280047-Prymnesium_polylepis.1
MLPCGNTEQNTLVKGVLLRGNHERPFNKSSAKKQKTDKPKSDKSEKTDKSDGASAKGRKAEKGT